MPTPTFIPSIVQDQVIKALGDWLTALLPAGVQIVQGFEVNVPAPQPNPPGVTGYVSMYDLGQERYSTSVSTSDATSRTVGESMGREIQLDLYGPDAGDWVTTIRTLFRDPYAVDAFNALLPGLAPTYEDEPHQAPLSDGEHQWEKRWILVLHFNYTPVVVVAQNSANELQAGIHSVTVDFPST